jgi:hypothetical protein
MMEAARTSERLINFYQTTRRYNPEDSHLRIHRRENLKSYQFVIVPEDTSCHALSSSITQSRSVMSNIFYLTFSERFFCGSDVLNLL